MMSLEDAPQRQVVNNFVALAFTISEFCAAHRISRSWLYKEWKAGRGPRIKRIGSKVIITSEAAADWRHEDVEAGPC
jgi:predicted DNA-binding transcriptional regulator AlpA